jgi:hypothetical protein
MANAGLNAFDPQALQFVTFFTAYRLSSRISIEAAENLAGQRKEGVNTVKILQYFQRKQVWLRRLIP